MAELVTSDMSDENQMFTAEFKDGRLQIVEVSPCDKKGGSQNGISFGAEDDLPELSSDDGEHTKYLQVLDTGKGLVQLNMLNFTLVKNADGTSSYQIAGDSAEEDAEDTITCVLREHSDEEGPRETYVMLQTDGDQDPYMYLQSAVADTPADTEISKEKALEQKALTPVEILEKAKSLQKAKSLLSSISVTKNKRGRKRKSDLPPPMELLASPNFKLYLYSCKMCTFKCNAIKEMSIHKKLEHSGGASGVRAACLQCARCPYRGHTHAELMKHVKDSHTKETSTSKQLDDTTVQFDAEEVEAADVLVCGACGFESGDRALFKKHIEDDHGVTTSIA